MLPATAPDLTSLDIFSSVAELGSLGRAADRHLLSQPAVSMRMKELEQRLNLTLFQRGPSGTQLTPDGEKLMFACRRVLAETEILITTAAALRTDVAVRVRVSASLTIAEYLIPGWIRTLMIESPQLSLALEVVNTAAVFEQVRSGRADIGFVEGIEGNLEGLDGETVGHDRLEVVVAPDHPWAHRNDAISGAELAELDLVTREPGSGTREALELALAPWGGVRSRVVMGSTGAILGAARRGESPAVLSAIAVAADIAEGRLVAVRTDGLDLSRRFRAVWRAHAILGPMARRLLVIAASSQSTLDVS